MPWDASAPNLGFSGGVPWLPLGPTHQALSVSQQESDPKSTLNYARKVLAARRKSSALRLGDISLIETAKPVLAFARTSENERVLCIFNLSGDQVEFRYANLGASRSLGVECGSVVVKGEHLSLGPFAAYLTLF
jgi:alpha-glucosidase